MSKPCPFPSCPETIPDGLIFCGNCWGRLPGDLKASLIYYHPDVASRRAMKKAGESQSYNRLMRNALGVLELKAKALAQLNGACKSFERNKSDGICLNCGKAREQHTQGVKP